MKITWTRELLLENINRRADGRGALFAKGFLMPNDITDEHVAQFQELYDKYSMSDPTWLERGLLDFYNSVIDNMA